MNKNDFYIYNSEQSIFFIKNGLIPIKVGVGSSGNPYLRFKRDKESEKIFDIWCKREH